MLVPVCEIMARRDVYVGMKRRKRGSTCTWSGVTARIMRRSYTMRKRSHANPFSPRLENPHAARRFPWTSKSDKLPEKASNSCSILKVRKSRRVICFFLRVKVRFIWTNQTSFVTVIKWIKRDLARGVATEEESIALSHYCHSRYLNSELRQNRVKGQIMLSLAQMYRLSVFQASHFLCFLNSIQVNFSHIVL